MPFASEMRTGQVIAAVLSLQTAPHPPPLPHETLSISILSHAHLRFVLRSVRQSVLILLCTHSLARSSRKVWHTGTAWSAFPRGRT